MNRNLSAFLVGVIFSLGLCISQMVNPKVVLDFLDVTGAWDPRLMFVMGGALLVAMIAFPIVLRFQKPVFDKEFSIPTSKIIDRKLIGGAALFGIGWGLVGICPGPAVAVLPFGAPKTFLFFVSLLVGMAIYKKTNS